MATSTKNTKLSRERDQRRALLKSLTESLIIHESIVTTEAKARTLRPYVEKLVTKAKQNTDARRRLLRSRLNTDATVDKLFDTLAPRYTNRPGGYIRLSSAGVRRGDNAKLLRVSFVEETPEKTAGTDNNNTAAQPETEKQTSKEEK